MSVETEIQTLTEAVEALTDVVGFKQAQLEAAVTSVERAASEVQAVTGVLYDSVALGLSATVEGQQFRVRSYEADIASYRYVNDGDGTATLLEAIPSAGIMAEAVEATADIAAVAEVKGARDVALSAKTDAETARDQALTYGNINQTVANQADRLALTGLAANWRVLQSDTQNVWQWSGSEWEDRGDSPLADKASLSIAGAIPQNARTLSILQRDHFAIGEIIGPYTFATDAISATPTWSIDGGALVISGTFTGFAGRYWRTGHLWLGRDILEVEIAYQVTSTSDNRGASICLGTPGGNRVLFHYRRTGIIGVFNLSGDGISEKGGYATVTAMAFGVDETVTLRLRIDPDGSGYIEAVSPVGAVYRHPIRNITERGDVCPAWMRGDTGEISRFAVRLIDVSADTSISTIATIGAPGLKNVARIVDPDELVQTEVLSDGVDWLWSRGDGGVPQWVEALRAPSGALPTQAFNWSRRQLYSGGKTYLIHGQPQADGQEVARASIGGVWGAHGGVRAIEAHHPRISYDLRTGRPGGLLIEEARTRRNASPNDLGAAWWSKVGTTVTAAQHPRFGTVWEVRDTVDTSDTSHYVGRTSGNVFENDGSTPRVAWCLAKAGTWSLMAIGFAANAASTWGAVIDLSTGEIAAVHDGCEAFCVPVGDGFYMVGVSHPTGNTSSGNSRLGVAMARTRNLSNSANQWQGDGKRSIFVAHLTGERGLFPSSPIPGATAGTERSSDAYTFGLPDAVAGDTFGLFVAATPSLNSAYKQTLIDLASDEDNHINVYRGADGVLSIEVITDGDPQGDYLPVRTVQPMSAFQAAIRISADRIAASVDGSPLVWVDGPMDIPALVTASVGALLDGTHQWGNMVTTIAIYGRDLADADLVALSKSSGELPPVTPTDPLDEAYDPIEGIFRPTCAFWRVSGGSWQTATGEAHSLWDSGRVIHTVRLSGLPVGSTIEWRMPVFSRLAVYTTYEDDPTTSIVLHWHTDQESFDYDYTRVPIDVDVHKSFTAPDDITDRGFRVVGVSDTHRVLDPNIERLICERNPDVIIHSGDVGTTNGNPLSFATMGQFLECLTRLTDSQGRHIPFLPNIGNHEIAGITSGGPAGIEWAPESVKVPIKPDFRNGIRGNAEAYYGCFPAFPGLRGFGSLDFGDYYTAIVIDAGITTLLEDPDDNQLEWLEGLLGDRRDVPHKIATAHYNPYCAGERSNGNTYAIGMRTRVGPVLYDGGVRLFLVGHDHVLFRSNPIDYWGADGHQIVPPEAIDGMIIAGCGTTLPSMTREGRNPHTKWWLADSVCRAWKYYAFESNPSYSPAGYRETREPHELDDTTFTAGEIAHFWEIDLTMTGRTVRAWNSIGEMWGEFSQDIDPA